MTMTDYDSPTFKDLIPLKEVPKRISKIRGKKIHLSQPYRWAKKGLDGVPLRTVKVGGTMFTTERWLWDFFNRTPGNPRKRKMTPKRRQRQLDRVEAELAAKGI